MTRKKKETVAFSHPSQCLKWIESKENKGVTLISPRGTRITKSWNKSHLTTITSCWSPSVGIGYKSEDIKFKIEREKNILNNKTNNVKMKNSNKLFIAILALTAFGSINAKEAKAQSAKLTPLAKVESYVVNKETVTAQGMVENHVFEQKFQKGMQSALTLGARFDKDNFVATSTIKMNCMSDGLSLFYPYSINSTLTAMYNVNKLSFGLQYDNVTATRSANLCNYYKESNRLKFVLSYGFNGYQDKKERFQKWMK